ncbi:MAG: hypothetical protein E6J90_01315 [Deltaproteobacteria bacterium]|nr:MAG: hypothetical protein E6J90_01315 [Deltaproteobacteria bacterium]
MHRIEIEDQRAGLPWPYLAILLGEIAVLGHWVAASAGRPPRIYEMGWLGCGSMLVMQVYSIRRRVRALSELGPLRAWLDLHVFLGLQGFVLVAYHSVGVSPRASLAAINFALVAIVVATGVIGRYLYGLIPRARRTRQGSLALDIAERAFARWIVLHRPLAVLLLAITTLHVLAHFAYAV